ncbi:putative reverse transcriptase domain-containing protein [Tanacetum coccineum]
MHTSPSSMHIRHNYSCRVLLHKTCSQMQQAEMAELRETDRRRQAQMVETLRVMRDMRRIMAPVTRRGPNTPPNNTNQNNMTQESVQATIDQALLQNSTNGDGSHSSHGDNRRNVQTARPCFYADFMKCQPLNFKGTEGVVGLTRWIKKMESVFNISGCAIENQVKFATCTLLGAALTWWNGQIRTLGPEAYSMTWEVLKKKMTDKYCPQGEIKKLEIELWNLKVKGNDVPTYTERFQELTLICTKFVANETEKVDKYISGLPDNIYGNVKSARPKTLDETIELANDLMDQKLRTYAERQSDNKRKADDSSRNNHGHQQQPFKRQNVAKVYNMGTKEALWGILASSSNSAISHHNGPISKGNVCFECEQKEFSEDWGKGKVLVGCGSGKKGKREWESSSLGSMEEKEFKLIKKSLYSATNSALPEGTKTLVVYCLRHQGLGAVLIYREKVIAYASRQLKVHEKNYTTHDLELGRHNLKGYTQGEIGTRADGNTMCTTAEFDTDDHDVKKVILDGPNMKAELRHTTRKPEWKWIISTRILYTKLPSHHKVSTHLGDGGFERTKSAHFLPIREDDPLDKLARLYLNRIVARYGIPALIICDRDGRFTSNFLRSFQKALGTNIRTTKELPLIRKRSRWRFEIGDRVKQQGLTLERGRTIRLELPQELSRVHHTFHVYNLKKCYANEPLVMPLEGIHVDDNHRLRRAR